MLQTLIQWFISLTGEAQIMAIVGVMGMLGGIILFLKGEIHTYLTSTKRAARVVFRQSAKQAKKEQKSEGIFFGKVTD